MATRAKGRKRPELTRRLMEELMFGAGRVRRFTQDTPVMPDVWLAYADRVAERRPVARGSESEKHPAIKLLLTPYRETSVGRVRVALCGRLERSSEAAVRREFGHRSPIAPRVIYNQTTVAATLQFEDLVRAVLPMTEWWQRFKKEWRPAKIREAIEPLAIAVEDPEHARLVPRAGLPPSRPPAGLLWMIRVVGALALHLRGEALPWDRVPQPPARAISSAKSGAAKSGAANAGGRPDPGWRRIVEAVADLIDGVEDGPPDARLFSINLNRHVSAAVAKSTLAVKADAARQLFNISCDKVTWAVIDSGVDATHPAFRRRQTDGERQLLPEPFAERSGRSVNQTRILATYDFTRIDLLLDPETDDQPRDLARRLKKARPAGAKRAPGRRASELEIELDDLHRALRLGRFVDWQQLAPLLRMEHDAATYERPGNDHGTHVAGILAGDWKRDESNDALEEDLVGVAPDLRLFDLRVLDDQGLGDEFAVMAALQFVRHLNASHDYVVVHGVNLSLSIPHDVANYACGRTPVCDETERVVGAGIVVVAAAGNQGYRRYRTEEDGVAEAYNSSSITDPGNAASAITVGATHRYRPHQFGVSYFSSRGPTGDGRAKPDLVAPGEKINGPLPDGLFGLKDGTSMAAPHVSGAAALLLARHQELVGQPTKVKETLCRSATDLGRERYFQGAGMLDILRALQAI